MDEVIKYKYNNISFLHSGKISYDRILYSIENCHYIGLREWGLIVDDDDFFRIINIKDEDEKLSLMNNIVIHDCFEGNDFKKAIRGETSVGVVFENYDKGKEYDNVLFCIARGHKDFFCVYKTEQFDSFNYIIVKVCYLSELPLSVFEQRINDNRLSIKHIFEYPRQTTKKFPDYQIIIEEKFDIFKYMIKEHKPLQDIIDYYYKLRHDIVLYLILYSLSLPPMTDVSVPGFDKTPDIFFDDLGNTIIGDVSVTLTPSLAREEKRKKYIDLINHYKLKGNRVIEAFYCVKPSLLDLDFSLKCPKIKFHRNFPIDSLTNYFEELKVYLNLIYEHYNRKEFDEIKAMKYNKELFEEYHFNQEDLNVNINEQDYFIPTDIPEEIIIDNYKQLLKESNIYEKYAPKRLEKEDIINGYMELSNKNLNFFEKEKYKPSFHMMVPFFDPVNFRSKIIIDLKEDIDLEQKNLMKFMTRVNKLADNLSYNNGYIFVKDLAKYFLKSCGNDNSLNVFLKGEEFLSQYKEKYRENNIRGNFFDYLRENLSFPTDDEPYFVKRKIIRVPHQVLTSNSREFWKTSGTSFKNYNKVEEKAFVENETYKLSEKAQKTTIDVDYSFDLVNDFIDYLTTKDDNPLNIPKHYSYKEIPDHPSCNELREMMVNDYYPYLNSVYETRAHKFHKFSSDCYDQLLHFSSFTMNNNRYALYNCGIKNFCTIVCMSYHDKGKDVGQAYMNVGFGPSNLVKKYSKLFGKVQIIELREEENICLYFTNWRRLPGFKLTFLRDSYFSVLSSSVISLMRDNYDNERVYDKQLSRKYVLRSLISLCSNQQLAEFLMDMRYYQVSLFSLYTNIKELIADKFTPPYSCAMVGYIVKLIQKSVDFYEEIRQPGSFIIKGIVIDELGRRSDKSVGFQKIQFKSFFHKGFVLNEQDLLDDLFIYVHTMKEPSNVFHEEIKALQTIKDYEEKYRELPLLLSNGHAKSLDEFREFYKGRKDMGFISGVIKDASRKFILKLKPDVQKIITRLNDEHISEITSTKAVIENDRFRLKSYYTEEVTLKKKSKRYTKRNKAEFDKRLFRLREKLNLGPEFENVINELHNIYKPEDFDTIFSSSKIKNAEELFRRSRLRVKVHDSILGLMRTYEDKGYNKTVQFIEEFIKEDHDIIADICIKAQYGSKREFYVMNLAAKLYARIYEGFFKELAKICSSEMISVAGDEKIIRMQTILTEAIKYSEENNTNIVYINGDCTKWSASEIMQSFASMIYGFKEILPEKMFNFLIYVTKKWSQKKIQVPQDILQKVFPVIKETDYLKKLDEDYCIESTHNFLQGVFNYCSSMKAVICAEYTQYIYNKIYPGSKTKYFHMEHSDDYAGVLCFEGERDLVEFKTLHNMLMGACSMTDSAKKTTIQNIMFEFVSLIGFNGSMTYPSIKKTKEVGTNTACIGYAQDMSNVGSRTSEILRIGLPQSCAYYFSRVHNHCIMKAYSCFDGMKNDITTLTKIDKSELPVELFGETNVIPIFYLLCKGDPNNYRLLKYSKYNNYLLSLVYSEKFKNSILNDETGEFEIWAPYYMFKFENKLIKSIKRYFVKADVEEAKKYWEEKITYNFYKPTNSKDMLDWLKYMYYKRSFALAYNRVSRMQMSLRISSFTSSECLAIEDIFESEEKRLLNMRQLQVEVFEMLNNDDKLSTYDYNMLDFILLKGDDNAKIIYDWFNRVKIRFNYQKNSYHTIATRLPYRSSKVPIDNTPGNLIEYMFAPDCFEKNERRILSNESLYNDQMTVEKTLFNYCNLIKNDSNPSTRLRALQIVYSILILSTKKRNIAMLTNRDALTINDYLYVFHNTMFSYNYYGQVNMLNISMINSFFSQYLLSYDNLRKAVDFESAIISSLSFIMMYLSTIENCSTEQINLVLSSLYIQQKYRNIPVKDYLSSIDPTFLEHKNEKKEYLMQLAIVKYIFMNDVSVVNYLLKKNTMYQFKYLEEQKRTSEGWVGDCVVMLRTFSRKSRFEYKRSKITMYTQHDYISQALLTFVIGLENTGLKEKTNMFEKITFTKEFLKKYHIFMDNNKKKILYDEFTGYYKYSNEPGVGLPIYYSYSLEAVANYEVSHGKQSKITFDSKTFTVLVDGFKFFTMPLTKTFYYPVFKCEKIIINDFDFSKMINHNIKNILFDKHYDINFEEALSMIDDTNFYNRIKEKNKIHTTVKIRDNIVENPLMNEEFDYLVYPGELARRKVKNKDYDVTFELTKKEKKTDNVIHFGKEIYEIIEKDKGTQIEKLSMSPEEIARERERLFEEISDFILPEEEYELEEDEHFIDQMIMPDDIMSVQRQRKYITIEYKRKRIQRMMKINRWTTNRILSFIMMGDFRDKYRMILHDSLFSLLDSLSMNREKRIVKFFYENIIKKTLPLLRAEQRFGDYIIKPTSDEKIIIYKINKSTLKKNNTIQKIINGQLGLPPSQIFHLDLTKRHYREDKSMNYYYYLTKLDKEEQFTVTVDILNDKRNELFDNMEHSFKLKFYNWLDEFNKVVEESYDDEEGLIKLTEETDSDDDFEFLEFE